MVPRQARSPMHAEYRSRSSSRTRPQRSWPMPPMTTTSPFLITGAGRSGTGWAAALFTALGYPCGHDTVFRYDGVGAFHQPDSSWLAVPYAAPTPLSPPLLSSEERRGGKGVVRHGNSRGGP